jgi:Lon protease-like protein
MRTKRIPLFPLDVVLLPGATLPLHIFEQRYKLMISGCFNENREFGIIQAGNNGVATVGCTAAITQKIKDYPDGRMDILTQGRTAFRALKLLQEKEYHEVVVEYLSDVPTPRHESIDCRETDGLFALFQECHSLIYGQIWVTTGTRPQWPLSYQLAARLPLDLEEKQKLLEIRDELNRQDFLIDWMNQLLPRLGNQQRARSTAAGTGHRLN